MALDERDIALIRQVVSEQIAVGQAQDRRRRRFWLWFWIWFFIITTALSGWASWRLVASFQDQIAAQEAAFQETKREYQAELARNKAWQAERIAAEKAVGYDNRTSQASHEANEMQRVIGMLAKSNQLQAKWAQLDLDDPENLDVLAQDMSGILNEGLGSIARIMLRNTDPALNTAQERMLEDVAAGNAANQANGEPLVSGPKPSPVANPPPIPPTSAR
jgi:hypothetical protein